MIGCDAVCCDVIVCDPVRCNVIGCDAVCWDVIRCDAGCCDVIGCDAVCCDVIGCYVSDEPTNHLDLESVEALIEGLNAFVGGVVVSTHDARLVEGLEVGPEVPRSRGPEVPRSRGPEVLRCQKQGLG